MTSRTLVKRSESTKLENPYLPMAMRIQRVTVETDDGMLKSFDLSFVDPRDAERFNFVPGQFCEISVFGKGEAPFGIASSPTESGPVKFTGAAWTSR